MSDISTISVHGRRVAFRRAGDTGQRPCVVLVHGIAGDGSEWEPVLDTLSTSYDVIAPDLAGHGESTRLRGDHSIGAFATWLRDVLEALEVERATFVGHSLGGGVVMQFAYQFPEYVERMVLVSSGGLGREVSALIRAASLPGAEWVLGGVGVAARSAEPLLAAVGVGPRTEYGELVHRIGGLTDGDRRAAFVRAVRAIASPGGQRVNASDRLYLAEDVPTVIVWGARDRIIPVTHAHATHEAVPGSELVIFDEAGHFPHGDDPERFTAVLENFIRSTDPASYDKVRIRRRMTSRDDVENRQSAPSGGEGGQITTSSSRPDTKEPAMPKYLLLKHYTGGPEPLGCPPMNEWTPDEIAAHIQFQRDTVKMLTERGEFVDALAAAPTGNWVRYGGPDKGPDVLDGPFPETKELVAGWFLIDVESEQRAHEVAAFASSAPGPRGEPIYEWIEVRPVMSEPPSFE